MCAKQIAHWGIKDELWKLFYTTQWLSALASVNTKEKEIE